jgi:hypothetical protein
LLRGKIFRLKNPVKLFRGKNIRLSGIYGKTLKSRFMDLTAKAGGLTKNFPQNL